MLFLTPFNYEGPGMFEKYFYTEPFPTQQAEPAVQWLWTPNGESPLGRVSWWVFPTTSNPRTANTNHPKEQIESSWW